MRKLRNLIGMPVLCRSQRIGRLVQAELSDDLKRMEGIWIDGGLRGTRYIPSDRLAMIGQVAVIADNRGQRKRLRSRPLLYRAVSTDGSRVGAIVGAEIDELSFCVCSLELTRGLWDDLFVGRTRIEDYTAAPEHGEVIVMNSDNASEKEE